MAQPFPSRALREIDELFEELEALLKNPEVEADLAVLGVNTSLAMVTAAGLRAYLRGDKAAAVEELSTAVEEIASRYAASQDGGGGSNGAKKPNSGEDPS